MDEPAPAMTVTLPQGGDQEATEEKRGRGLVATHSVKSLATPAWIIRICAFCPRKILENRKYED